jgi:uncharacterized membrane protein
MLALSVVASPAALRAGRHVWTVLMWIFVLVGGTGLLLAVAIHGPPDLSADDMLVCLVAGAGTTIANLFLLLALRSGAVGLVIPVVACDGAIAATLAYATGTKFDPIAAPAVATMAIGIAVLASHQPNSVQPVPGRLASGPPTTTTVSAPGLTRRAALVAAAGAATAYGINLYVLGRATEINPLWLLGISRTFAAAMALVITIRLGQVTIPRGALPWVAAVGWCHLAAFLAYIQGARQNLPIAAVATSQYAGIAVLMSVVYLRERLLRRDALGILLLLVGAAILAGSR